MTSHNLPIQPYKKFFGRKDALDKITDILIEGGTYIASIDGVGGIGKTALTHFFCDSILLKSNYFDYLVWITAKDSVFDSYNSTIKNVENDFTTNSIEHIINETIKVVGFPELLLDTIEVRKLFEIALLDNHVDPSATSEPCHEFPGVLQSPCGMCICNTTTRCVVVVVVSFSLSCGYQCFF